MAYTDSDGKNKIVNESDIVYRQTRVSKDPYSLMPEDVSKIKSAVDNVIDGLDKLLNGQLKKDNWLNSDKMDMIWPPKEL